MVLYAIGGLLPALFGGMAFILIMRGVYGAGCGFLIPLSQSLIADFFQGRDRDVFMGYRSSVAAVFGMFFTTVGGYLCAMYWRNTFFAYLLVVPVFLLVLIKMPEPERAPASEAGNKGELTGKMWFWVAMYFLYNIFMMCYHTNAAFVMSEARVGSARTIGFIMTISNIGGIIAGLLLGRITRVMKSFTLVLALGFMSLGFILLNFVGVAHTFGIACAIWGFGFGVFVPGMSLKIINSVPNSATTRALALLTCALGIGQFISPRAYFYINRLLGLEGPRASWTVAAFCFAAAFLVSLAATLKSERMAPT